MGFLHSALCCDPTRPLPFPVMATDKRARQRANREEKKAAEAKAKRRQETFATVKKWTIYAVVIVAILLVTTFLLR